MATNNEISDKNNFQSQLPPGATLDQVLSAEELNSIKNFQQKLGTNQGVFDPANILIDGTGSYNDFNHSGATLTLNGLASVASSGDNVKRVKAVFSQSCTVSFTGTFDTDQLFGLPTGNIFAAGTYILYIYHDPINSVLGFRNSIKEFGVGGGVEEAPLNSIRYSRIDGVWTNDKGKDVALTTAKKFDDTYYPPPQTISANEEWTIDATDAGTGGGFCEIITASGTPVLTFTGFTIRRRLISTETGQTVTLEDGHEYTIISIKRGSIYDLWVTDNGAATVTPTLSTPTLTANAGDTQITLVITNEDASQTGRVLLRNTVNDEGTATAVAGYDNSASYVDDNNGAGLVNGTEYFYFFYNTAAGYNNSATATDSATPSASIVQLIAPTANTPTVDSSTAITVTCNDPNTSPQETSMLFRRADDVGMSTNLITSQQASGATSYQFTGLTENTQYFFDVIAEGDGVTTSDSSPSNVVNATTDPAAASLTFMINGDLLNNGSGFTNVGALINWKIDDGGVITNISSNTVPAYTLVNPTATVEITSPDNYVSVTVVNFTGQPIVGNIDLSVLTLVSGNITIDGCPDLTGVVYPSNTNTFSLIRTRNCNITGAVDLTPLTDIASVDFSTNTLLTDISLNNSNTLTSFTMHNTGLSGSIDISNITSIGGSIDIYQCPALTNVIFPTTTTASTSIKGYNSNFTGTLNLSMFTQLSGILDFDDNTLMTGVTLPATTGRFTQIDFTNCNLTGIVDFSMLSNFTNILTISGNTNLTAITFPTTSQDIRHIDIYNCDLTGVVDLSGLTGFGGTGIGPIRLYGNTNMTGITLPTTTNNVGSFSAYSASLGYVNFNPTSNILSKDSVPIDISNNGMTATEVNHILVDLASLVAGEAGGGDYTGRSIDISGTNAAPDGSSGGFDGTQAVTDLQGKGITVTIS